METRLNDLVIAGVIFNTRPYSVHGQLQLRGAETPMLIELTGAPSEELRGRHFEFEVFENEGLPNDADRAIVKQLADQQIGPCRLTKAAGMGDAAEIRLEWFGQNGRIVLDLATARIRFLALERGTPADAVDEDDDESEVIPDFPPLTDEESGEEDYGLIPEDLNRELERSAQRTDLEIAGESEESLRALDEYQRMDDLLENGKGVPIQKLIAKLDLPAIEDIGDEAQAFEALTRALAEIALYGVAFHICEHCTARAAYRVFIENSDIWKIFPEMRGSSWVQHFSTSDVCPECLGESSD